MRGEVEPSMYLQRYIYVFYILKSVKHAVGTCMYIESYSLGVVYIGWWSLTMNTSVDKCTGISQSGVDKIEVQL